MIAARGSSPRAARSFNASSSKSGSRFQLSLSLSMKIGSAPQYRWKELRHGRRRLSPTSPFRMHRRVDQEERSSLNQMHRGAAGVRDLRQRAAAIDRFVVQPFIFIELL